MRGIFRALTLVLAVAVLTQPAKADRFTLADALAYAYTNNPELEAARERVKGADNAVAEARGNWRPSLSVSGSWGAQRTNEITFGFPRGLELTPMTARAALSEPVITGGQANAQVQRAIALVRAARAELLNAEQQILLASATAYMDVVRDAETLHLHQSDVDVLARQRIATKTQVDAGAATKTDLQQVDVRLAQAQAELALAQAQLAQSRNSFERIIGKPAQTLETSPPLPHLPGTQDQALALALKFSPRIQSAQAQDKAAEYGIDNAVGALLPHASIIAAFDFSKDSLSFGRQSQVDTASVLAQVQIPLYQGGAEEARIREAKNAKSQTRLGIVDADQATRQALRDAWAAFHAAQTAVAYNQLRVKASEEALNGVIQQQHQGERSILDILNAEQERLAAEVALSSSHHDMVVSSFQLLAATGSLTAKQLGLKVKLYDPNEHYNAHSSSWIDFGD